MKYESRQSLSDVYTYVCLSTREDFLFFSSMKSYSALYHLKRTSTFSSAFKNPEVHQLSSVSIALREETTNDSVSNATNSAESTRSFLAVTTATTRTTGWGLCLLQNAIKREIFSHGLLGLTQVGEKFSRSAGQRSTSSSRW